MACIEMGLDPKISDWTVNAICNGIEHCFRSPIFGKMRYKCEEVAMIFSQLLTRRQRDDFRFSEWFHDLLHGTPDEPIEVEEESAGGEDEE